MGLDLLVQRRGALLENLQLDDIDTVLSNEMVVLRSCYLTGVELFSTLLSR